MLTVIKTHDQLASALHRIDALMDADVDEGSSEANELEVLAVLVRDYESRAQPLSAPNPIAAIKARMDQLDYSPKDLVQFLGTRSRVSEILSGKRALSLTMIRALHEGLSIPLESLIAENVSESESGEELEWDRFPVREMVKRGWLNISRSSARARISYEAAREALAEFFGGDERLQECFGALQKTDRVRVSGRVDRYALAAWTAFVLRRADRMEPSHAFDRADWDSETLRDLRGLSRFDVGPRLAVQFLEERGVIVDVVPHLPRTRLDGAAMMRRDGTPVIAITLRRDRLDNFWFTLFHELMHVLHHLDHEKSSRDASRVFLDDLEATPVEASVEADADKRARDALIPRELWDASAVRYVIAPVAVTQLAREASVADAVVAGRVRHERKNYRLLSQMVGSGAVRIQFPEVNWPSAEEK